MTSSSGYQTRLGVCFGHSPRYCLPVTMSKNDIMVAFDCGGIFANDIPVDMFKKLAKDHYKPEDQARVSDIHARKFVALPSTLL